MPDLAARVAPGQFGIGSTEGSDKPVEVSTLSEVSAIAAGRYFSLDLLRGGTAKDAVEDAKASLATALWVSLSQTGRSEEREGTRAHHRRRLSRLAIGRDPDSVKLASRVRAREPNPPRIFMQRRSIRFWDPDQRRRDRIGWHLHDDSALAGSGNAVRNHHRAYA
jgi:hypothetical protein